MRKYLCMMLAAMTMSAMTACSDDSDSNKSECTNDAVQCSTSGVPQKCVDGTWKDQTACTGNSTCDKGECKPAAAASCEAAACAAKTGNDYVGNICVGEGAAAKCGCSAKSDCKEGFDCDTTAKVCKPEQTASCDAAACAAKSVDDYAGNICIGEGAAAKCGCSAKTDCNNDLECNKGKCTECVDDSKQCTVAGTPQLCINGKWTDQTSCTNTERCDHTKGECVPLEPEECTPEACKTNEYAYAGNLCIDGDNGKKKCGCDNTADSCNTGFKCNEALHVCERDETPEECVPENCEAKSIEQYAGNVCIQTTDGEACGCENQDHCRDGYTCNTVSGSCETDCSVEACKAMTGDDYSGNVCIETSAGMGMTYIDCGCYVDTDCNDPETQYCHINTTDTDGKDMGFCKAKSN